ncbi:MAG: hypothetical protein KQH83_05200 [Actinobacteria bacterium]|nr:hypothetical protein [Actinomycetota bacterium]
MSDLRARDRHDPEWGGTVVDLLEEDRVVGLAYEDDDGLFVEFYPDEDGNAWVFDAADLQRVLDTVRAMLGAEEPSPQAAPAGEEGQHPVDALAMQFDHLAAKRGEEDEGFYPLQVAAAILARCADLGLALVYVEGVTIHRDGIDPVPGHKADLGETNEGSPFALFQAECNTQAAALLERWPREPGFAVALEVQDATGERFVL